MHILSNQQVQYCNLFCHIDGSVTYLPGVLYGNKLFKKNKFFNLEQEQEALEYGKSHFLAAKGEKSYILLKDNIGFTVWIEDSSAELCPNNNQDIDIINTIDIEELVTKMRNIGGIKIQDRNYKFKTYHKCFVGNEAVEWMRTNLSLSTEQAIRLGQRLIDEKLIHHVVDQQNFANEFFFYRFYWDEN